MYLLFDLSKNDRIHLALFTESDIVHDADVSARNRELLPVLDDFLTTQRVTVQQIRGIMVVFGSGGFTSARIAAVLANACAYVLRIPLLGIAPSDIDRVRELIPDLLRQPCGGYISATYSGQPNITMR